MSNSKIHLPVDDFIPEILEHLKSSNAIVVTASPGAGKTTRIPAALMQLSKKKVAVLEPRRIAAVAAAHRVAEEENQEVGTGIGYEVRFDRKITADTKLVFLTEALLSRKLLSDPQLKEFDIVVLDEFHERSLHTDTALALLYELQQLERPDLKIVIMSATLEAQKISEYLGNAPIVNMPGRLFPLEVHYDSKPQGLLWGWDYAKRVAEKIKVAVRSGEKDTLVFLPGVFEIDQTMKTLAEDASFNSFMVLPLHGRLDLREQRRALQPQGQRKIILSTNVAESSVTVDGLDAVVDTGLERSSVFQMQSGFGKLTTHRISLASATQRAGRAARQFPGKCFKLWTPLDEKSFPPFSQPEIKSQDLTETLLFLSFLGIKDFESFSWFEVPPKANLKFALDKMRNLHLLDNQGITALGKKVLMHPMSIRLSLLMENFKAAGHEALGAWVCAFLSERIAGEVPKDSDQEECDITPLLEKAFSFDKIKRVATQVSSKSADWKWNPSQSEPLKENLAKSFADRLGRRRSAESDKGVLSNGRGVQISRYSRVKRSPYFIALEGTDTENSNETIINKASGISEEFLRKKFSSEFKESKEIIWDESKKTFLEKKRTTLWGLSVGSETTQPASQQYIETHLPEILFQNWEWLLKENEALKKWWERFDFYSQKVNPEVQGYWSDEKLKSVIENLSYGHKSLKSIAEADLIYFFENELGSEITKDFHKKAPKHIEAAGGRQIPIHYEGEQAPYVELKLQHAFVWKKTPTIGNNMPLTVVLLAPNMRPTQVTQDLEGFWKGSYAEVRKELKARYPKHDWPEKI